MEFANVYEDRERAEAYSKLNYPGTYYLAFRDIPEIIRRNVRPGRALDFGCGAGRSTQFLRGLGFEATGVDISEQMLAKARELDPAGDYRLSTERGPAGLHERSFDLVFSAFTFDNVPVQAKTTLFTALRRLLKPEGRFVNLVSTPEIYRHEWLSFSTKDFPGNQTATTGDTVYTVMLDVEDRRPVADVLWTDEDYRETYRQAGLEVVEKQLPLGRDDEPYAWVSETQVAPWAIYVLRPA
ncbi:MAG TPA: class I SAM-dependent methyltransferase [Fimbriimonadaceae bacterium]|nr:class I SAM-dependent methyltransferase [Fimbriimonadaceae bacterium]